MTSCQRVVEKLPHTQIEIFRNIFYFDAENIEDLKEEHQKIVEILGCLIKSCLWTFSSKLYIS